jgi:phosphoadenosine phosphosulfate reductase
VKDQNNHINRTINLLESQLKELDAGSAYATSSFQTQSVPLLHILSENFPKIDVIFLDTGFLFPETYTFKKLLADEFHLNVITLKSEVSPIQQKDDKTGLFQYALDPDYCCYINKVKPLNDFLNPGDLWISGVRSDQTSVRKKMDISEKRPGGITKFHPMLHWNSQTIYRYIKENDLPRHPLEKEGYVSIGCIPCTHKWADGAARGGRWVGSKKTECGLHTK